MNDAIVVVGSGDAKVEIERADIGAVDTPAAGDLRLVVRVVTRGFQGTIDSWVSRDVWSAFMRQLQDLDRNRQGQATFESMSPGELRLAIRSLDRVGHMGIEGKVGVRTGSQTISLEFSAIEFDPSGLPEIVRGLSMLRSD